MKYRKRERTLVAAAAMAAALTVPAGAQAASSTGLVSGTVGTELSLAVSAPATMSLSHAAPSTSSALVTVTSTQVSWTLSVSDNNTGANAGKLLKTAGAGAASVGSPLTNALQWSPDATTFTDLSATPATVGTGSLIGTKTVTWRQSLGASDSVTAGDTYALTAKYSVN